MGWGHSNQQVSGTPVRLFVITPCGDPHSRLADLHEYENSFTERTCTYRGDLSGMWGPQTLARELRRMYPGCKVKFSKQWRKS